MLKFSHSVVLLFIQLHCSQVFAERKNEPRELMFCKQTQLISIYNLGEQIFFQFTEGQWVWHPSKRHFGHEHFEKPSKEFTVRQLYFMGTNDSQDEEAYIRLIHDGFTGFIATSNNFTDVPREFGLLTSTNHDHHLWIQRKKYCSDYESCVHFEEWQSEKKAVSLQTVLIDRLQGGTNKIMHFIEDPANASNHKLVVAYTDKSSAKSKILIFTGNLNVHKKVTTFNNEQGTILGMFRFQDKIYFFTKRMLGVFDPVTEIFKALPDRPLAKEGPSGEKSLLNLLDLFGCKLFEETHPEEFVLMNKVNLVLNVFLGLLNFLLLASAVGFCALLSQRNNDKLLSHKKMQLYDEQKSAY